MNDSSEKHGAGLWVLANWGSAAGLAAAALAAGILIGWEFQGDPGPSAESPVASQPGDQAVWTCSMHPQVRQPEPGLCPICRMDLVRVDEADPSGASGLDRISLTPEAAALLEVRTAEVQRKFVTRTVRMVGQIDYDETRLAHITARFPGRLDRLFVDYTGITVRKGDHMVEIYSPELLAAQEELLQADRARRELKADDPNLVRESVLATAEAARQKLRLLDLTAEQIDRILRRGRPEDRLTVVAPRGGIVIEKPVREGQYVGAGDRLYSIADISQVWVRLEAYESDLAWIRYGQDVTFTTVAYPGRTFSGRIAFISPVLDERTRTVRVRVNAPNPDGALKPGMFVRAEVRSELAAGPKVVAADLAGKWISPMHPEVVKDEPGFCDVCGMPLVRAESLGYVSADANAAEPPLVIPTSAALRTGQRAVVYVEEPETDKPTYRMREVTLGPEAEDYVVVRKGLAAGQRVVVQGNFMIDSERQIRALPSMMAPASRAETPETAPAAAARPPLPEPFGRDLSRLYQAYFAIADALADDDPSPARSAIDQARSAVPDGGVLPADRAEAWDAHATRLARVLAELAKAEGIEAMRRGFVLLSDELVAVAGGFGPAGLSIHRLHCPMAFNNRGADWLQPETDVRNPYFGESMLRCGAVAESFGSSPSHAAPPDEGDHAR